MSEPSLPLVPFAEPVGCARTSCGGVFAVLMDAMRHLSLGQITDALFEVGGKYRRNVSAGSLRARPV